jgi:uncharacterized metal-binding protein YceD (DUF177 family)
MTLLIRDIPQDGQNFEWTEGKIKVKGFIYPIQGGFDLVGEISAHVSMDCSFCANTLEIPIQEKFHEVVVLGGGKIQGSQKEVELHQDELEVYYVDGPEIDLKPIVQQVVDVSLPLQPKCVQKGAPKGYPECIADWDYEKYTHQNDEKLRSNPFEVLKKLKKN